jgi:hypothetical protein
LILWPSSVYSQCKSNRLLQQVQYTAFLRFVQLTQLAAVILRSFAGADGETLKKDAADFYAMLEEVSVHKVGYFMDRTCIFSAFRL